MKYRKKLVAAGILAVSSIAAALAWRNPLVSPPSFEIVTLRVTNVAFTDLDGDKQPEALVYAMATTDGDGQADLCGSGGCNLYVLSLTPTSYRLVTAISLTRPSINVLPSISMAGMIWACGLQVAVSPPGMKRVFVLTDIATPRTQPATDAPVKRQNREKL